MLKLTCTEIISGSNLHNLRAAILKGFVGFSPWFCLSALWAQIHALLRMSP